MKSNAPFVPGNQDSGFPAFSLNDVSPHELKIWGDLLREAAGDLDTDFLSLPGGDGSGRVEWERDTDGEEFLSFIPKYVEEDRRIWVLLNNKWVPVQVP